MLHALCTCFNKSHLNAAQLDLTHALCTCHRAIQYYKQLQEPAEEAEFVVCAVHTKIQKLFQYNAEQGIFTRSFRFSLL